MFTGIVGALAPVERWEDHQVHGELVVEASPYILADLELGASVAVDGVCLTVTDVDNDAVSFDLVKSTIEDTTLSTRQPGHAVNIERALRTGTEVGGHEVSGHVDGVGTVKRVDLHPDDVRELTVEVSPDQAPVTRYLSQSDEPAASLEGSERALVMRMLQLPSSNDAAGVPTDGQHE